MKWNNRLKCLFEDTENSKNVLPPYNILEKALCTPWRWYRLLNNDVKMNALELIIFSEWLGVDPKEMIEVIQQPVADQA